MEIVNINKTNLEKHPGTICFINEKNPYFPLKTEWLEKRFDENLRIKLLYTTEPVKLAGFIEYVPGESAWRAVSAKNYLFIHCIWIYPNKHKNQGFGTLLINECINDAKSENYNGVAVVTSKNAFMAESGLFLKNGFRKTDSDALGNELFILTFKEGEIPSINNWESKLPDYQGLQILYSRQCPWVARFIQEIKDADLLKNLNIKITEIKTPLEAQNAPSLYATFNLINNGKLLADRYISMTRFKNILKKEKLI
jgi:ribosomal protein S18 acetylase RimI-like enzyme